MVADLLEAGQCGEHDAASAHSARLFGVGEELVDHLLVERRLFAGELGVRDLLDLVGQVGHQTFVGLGAAQDEGAGQSAEAGGRQLVVLPLDRRAEPMAERLLAAEQTRVHGIEDRPQLAEPVLDRCAGERELLARPQPAHRPSRLRVGVLHHLCLVEHDGRPVDVGEVFDVAGQQTVGGDDQLALGIAAEEFIVVASAVAGGSVVDAHVELRREPFGFGAPVAHDAERADDEVGPWAFEEMGEGGRRLAEAHVVGEAAPETEPGEELHPRQAAPLVVT